MNSGEGVLVLGRGHTRHYYSEYAFYSTISIYIAHWLLSYYGIILLFSYAIVEFYLFYYGADDMQIWVLWQKICVESLILRCPLMPACLFFIKCVLLQVHDELTGDFTRNGMIQGVISNQHQNLCYTDMINKQWYSLWLPPSIML